MRALVLFICVFLPVSASAQDEFWCWDADEIVADVVGSTVHLHHLAALLNCCPDPITFDIEVGDATIMVVERSEDPCDCQCCYNLKVTIEDVPPGPWNVLYRWWDFEIWDWTERVIQIEVPDLGQSLEPYVADRWASGCMETAGLKEPLVAPMTWGEIRVIYR
jgi:hypothetical protein